MARCGLTCASLRLFNVLCGATACLCVDVVALYSCTTSRHGNPVGSQISMTARFLPRAAAHHMPSQLTRSAKDLLHSTPYTLQHGPGHGSQLGPCRMPCLAACLALSLPHAACLVACRMPCPCRMPHALSLPHALSCPCRMPCLAACRSSPHAESADLLCQGPPAHHTLHSSARARPWQCAVQLCNNLQWRLHGSSSRRLRHRWRSAWHHGDRGQPWHWRRPWRRDFWCQRRAGLLSAARFTSDIFAVGRHYGARGHAQSAQHLQVRRCMLMFVSICMHALFRSACCCCGWRTNVSLPPSLDGSLCMGVAFHGRAVRRL